MVKFAVLWDMDGVIADSTRLHYQAWKVTLKPYGVDLTYERFARTFGQNNRAALTDFLGRQPTEDELVTVADKKEIRYRENIPGNLSLLPGVLDWLTRFQSWGVSQAVASSAPPENIETMVDCLRIRGFFGALVSGANIPGKPNPAVFLQAAANLGIPAQHCLVLEDAPAGVEGAKAGGMKCVAVLTTHTAPELKKADLIVNRLTDLMEAQIRTLLRADPFALTDDDFCAVVHKTRVAKG